MRRMLCAGLVVLVCHVVANAQQPEPAQSRSGVPRPRFPISFRTLFVVWQQNRAATEPIGTRASFGDMLNSITAPSDHVLAVKTTFWLSVH
jgi:hypothetical protein